MNRITMRNARNLAGLTEEKVCSELKITPDLLNAWETGADSPEIDQAVSLANLYRLPLDIIDFDRVANTPRRLTLEEIEALPQAAVIWRSLYDINNGVTWHDVSPTMIIVPGKDGVLVCGDPDGTWDSCINESLFADPHIAYWDQKPSDDLLPGISKEEYDLSPDEGNVVFPGLAEAITRRKITLKRFCAQIGLDFNSFWEAMTGQREFILDEIRPISAALELSPDEVRKIFFPDFALTPVIDINTRRILAPVK